MSIGGWAPTTRRGSRVPQWRDGDETGESAAIEAAERGISMAETSYEEDSEFGLRNTPGLEREIAEEREERFAGYKDDIVSYGYERALEQLEKEKDVDGYGADDPSKFDDFGPEDAELGEQLQREAGTSLQYVGKLTIEDRKAIYEAWKTAYQYGLGFQCDRTTDMSKIRMWGEKFTWTKGLTTHVMIHGTNWLDVSRDFINAVERWAEEKRQKQDADDGTADRVFEADRERARFERSRGRD